MRKDTLAAGAKSARFAGGIGDNDIFRNVAPEGERDETVVVIDKPVTPTKAFRPRGTSILVKQVGVEEVSPLLVDVQTVKQEAPAEGHVISVGAKVLDVTAGERVVFGKYAGTEFKLNGETFLIMDESDVKGIVYELTTGAELNVGGCIVGRA